MFSCSNLIIFYVQVEVKITNQSKTIKQTLAYSKWSQKVQTHKFANTWKQYWTDTWKQDKTNTWNKVQINLMITDNIISDKWI